MTSRSLRRIRTVSTQKKEIARDALIQRVWKGETFVTERSVDTLVKRLRRKIEKNPAQPDWLLTVWGTGYKAADVS